MNKAPTPIEAYNFCPKCAGKFEHKGGNCLKCIQCGYTYFVNAAPTAGVIILNDKNQVLLAKRKFEPKKGTWQSPGGFMKLGESYEDALHREVEEELGVKIRVDAFLGTFPETYEYSGVTLPFLAIYSAATIIQGVIKEQDDVEEARYFDIKELDGLDITYPKLRPLIKKYMTTKNKNR